MKKFFLILLSLIIVFQLTGCNLENEKKSNKIKIVTTAFPVYDFAVNVAGNMADVQLLMPTGAEAHSYEPTVQDVISIKECDLFICLGKGAEPWTKSIIDEKGSSGKVLEAMNYAELKTDKHSHEGHSEYEYDQHVWTSFENAQEIVNAISTELGDTDPENKSLYEKRAADYNKKLKELDSKFAKLAKKCEKTVVFADRFPFRYFVEDYNLRYFAAFPGCSAESEPSAATVAELIDTVKKENIPVIFYTETSNGQLPDAVCEETGAEKALLHSCHNVSKKMMNDNVTYIGLWEENYKSLEKIIK